VPASALSVPQEGDWLASVPQKTELIRPSRFIDAAKKGQDELLVEFWNDPEKAIEINKIDPIYQTALHWAARGGHLSTVKQLLAWGANPNFRDKTGETPLHKAAVGNYAACCSALLDAGANRDILNAQRLTAMDLTEDRNTRFALAPQGLVDEEDQPFEQVSLQHVHTHARAKMIFHSHTHRTMPTATRGHRGSIEAMRKRLAASSARNRP
jgi:ankyrin repeat protein